MIGGPLIIGFCAMLVTFAGGMLAFRLQSRQAALLGFSSGAIIGVALFDLFPEAIELGTPDHSVLTITATLACGLLSYLMLDGLFTSGNEHQSGHHAHLAPASLTAHSAMDGLAIGLAFQVSSVAGLIVAFAVLAHDFVDGANTVTLSLAGGTSTGVARRWLIADALAPIAGIVGARLISAPASALALLLAFFAGGFLYIGAGGLLPGRREGAISRSSAGLACLGVTFIYIVMRLAAS